MSDDKDYEVGYGKPPKETQFKPGHSGNRAGRPPKSKNFKTLITEELESKIEVKEGGLPRAMTKREAAAKSMVNDAIKHPSSRAAQRLLQLMDQFDHDAEAHNTSGGISEFDKSILRNLRDRIKEIELEEETEE